MPLLDDSADKDQLDKIVATLPKYPNDQVQKLYADGTIKDGELFECTGVDKHWKAGVFVKGKLCTATHPLSPVGRATPLPKQKRKTVARLMNIAETGWIPTAKGIGMPQKFVNVQSGKALYTAKSIDQTVDKARHDAPKIFDESEKFED